MKTKIISSLIFIIIAFLVSYIYYIIPKEISYVFNGIEYKLGSKSEDVNPITIHIKGKRYYSFLGVLGEEKFVGQLHIEGVSYYSPPVNTKTVIRFDKEGRGDMHYVSNKTDLPIEDKGYGYLYANRNLSEITIAEARKDGNGRSWFSSNGWMITAPAENKESALEISNKLMKKVLFSKLK